MIQDKFETPTLGCPDIEKSQGLESVKLSEISTQAVKCDFLSSDFKIQSLINKSTLQDIPMKYLEFDVEINQYVAEVQVSQVYENTSEFVIETEFIFAITAKAVFIGLKVLFDDRIIIGVIKEKEQAKREYQQGLLQGKSVIYSDISKVNPDLMKVQLGNLLPYQSATVILTYVEELDVCVNKFMRLSLVTTKMPRQQLRYVPSETRSSSLIEQIDAKQVYPVKVFVQINSQSEIKLLKSPTHKIISKYCQSAHLFVCTVELNDQDQQYLPNQDFVLLYANDDINKPQILIGQADYENKYCAQVTFIPDFNNLTLDDAYSAYLDENKPENNEFDQDGYYTRGEYIFLIDRSGSIEGLEKAKEALQLFIQSLPVDSYFQIYAIGPQFTRVFSKSRKFTKVTLNKAMESVKSLELNKEASEIREPLLSIFTKSQVIEGYPKNIILLINGTVSNSAELIQLIRLHTNAFCRVYTMGIGNGTSRYFLEMAAEVGLGMCEFVSDTDDLNDKVDSLLKDSITQFISNVRVIFQPDCDAIQAIIPDPSSLNGLKKNKPFTFYILFNQLQTESIELSYGHCDDLQYTNKLFFDPKDVIQTQSFHKLAASKLINEITKAAKQDVQQVKVLIKGIQFLNKETIVQTSLQYGVLSLHTSFICIVSENKDDIQRQLISNSENIKYIVPNLFSADYEAQQIQEGQSYLGECQGEDFMQEPCLISSIEEIFVQSTISAPFIFSDYAQMPDVQDEQKMDMDTIQIDFIKVILKQDKSGGFIYDSETLNQLGINLESFTNLIPSILNTYNDKNNIWITIIILVWLQEKWGEKRSLWVLIAEKAQDYLKSQDVQYSLIMRQAAKLIK